MSILNNTTKLQNLMDKINTLPEAENLDEVISDQDDLISQIQDAVNSLPEAGSGGAELETCTVNITSVGGNFGSAYGTCVYTTIENGQLKHMRVDGETNNMSISCVCGSLLIVTEGSSRCAHEFSELELLKTDDWSFFGDRDSICIFKITAEPNAVATLEIEID